MDQLFWIKRRWQVGIDDTDQLLDDKVLVRELSRQSGLNLVLDRTYPEGHGAGKASRVDGKVEFCSVSACLDHTWLTISKTHCDLFVVKVGLTVERDPVASTSYTESKKRKKRKKLSFAAINRPPAHSLLQGDYLLIQLALA